MSVEDDLKAAMTDPYWDIAVPADPNAWVRRRASRDRTRRAVVLPAVAAVLVGAVAVGAGGLTGVGRDTSGQTATDGGADSATHTAARDGLTLSLLLSDDTPAVGDRVTGTATVHNTRSQPVEIFTGCGVAPGLSLDYSVAFPRDPAAPEFVQAVMGPFEQQGDTVMFGSSVAQSWWLPKDGPRGDCPTGQPSTTTIAPGKSYVRKIAWTVQSPGGAPMDADLPARSGIDYVTPDGAGAARAGDPSATERRLDVDFTLGLHGGDPGRKSLTEVLRAAADDERFARVLGEHPRSTWRQAWALGSDLDSNPAAALAEQDKVQQTFNPVDTWYVGLLYDRPGGRSRTTARVDGRTGEVLDVTSAPDGN